MEMESIIAEYLGKKKTYERFKESLISLIYDVVEEHSQLSMHLVSGRVKDEESLRSKIQRKRSRYNTISDITDIVGIRIISYLESEVDVIGGIIEKEFKVDNENSIDKRKQADNEFGYKSLHYVVSMSDARCAQTEYRKYQGLKLEIQIRSILQHAWAEIEHDLGYKSAIGIPQDLKRNFSRLSALLEVADIEFNNLKKALTNYSEQVSVLIQQTPNKVDINTISLESLRNNNSVLRQALAIINSYTEAAPKAEVGYEQVLGGFKYFDIKTIAEIEQIINIDKDKYLQFVKAFCEFNKSRIINGVSTVVELIFFQHYLAAKSEDVSKVVNYLTNMNYLTPDLRMQYAQEYISFYQSSLI